LRQRPLNGTFTTVNTPRPQSAFTLIELLVVISIIGILASLALPAISGAMDSARRTQAKNDVVQIATAVTAYETEYGKLPPVRSTVDQVLINILMPPSGVANTNNPRGIVFLEVPQKKANSKKSGQVDGSGDFEDPWGTAYKIAVDDNYDHTILSAGNTPGPTISNLRKKVAVWNTPKGENDGQKKRRSVVSWE